MNSQTKTDNRRLDLKIQLRRQVLDLAGLGELRVLDLCCGEGLVWRRMRQHVKMKRYLGVDNKPRMPGVLRGDLLDDRFLEALPFHQFNVVDVDTYGEPWKPWRFLYEHLAQRTAVFLTHGFASSPGGSEVSSFVRDRLGIPLAWNIPMNRELALFAAPYCLLSPSPAGVIAKAWKISQQNVAYYGMICVPKSAAVPRKRKDTSP